MLLDMDIKIFFIFKLFSAVSDIAFKRRRIFFMGLWMFNKITLVYKNFWACQTLKIHFTLIVGPVKMTFQAAKCLRDALKKKKKCYKCHIGFDPPPPNVTKNTMYFLKKLYHFCGTFEKKNCPPERSKKTCKIV